ncbi:hypothetical protein PspLS_03739 [Pyricularia sp. CBS 133598]|nr:hypothetical protein PspLS_03739 [Pyricularia sp. CBS 133598]
MDRLRTVAAEAARPSHDTEATVVVQQDVESQPVLPEDEAGSGQKTYDHVQPAQRLTAHQIFYILGMHGIGAMLISGGINFGIAYAMYANQDPDTSPIRVWQFPNTLAGDTAVTIIIQCLVTWFIESAILKGDLRGNKVEPLRLQALPRPKSRFLRWLFLLDDDRSAAHCRGNGPKGFLAFVVAQALRALLLAVPSVLILWPPSIGALLSLGSTRYGNDPVFEPKWGPEIFKGVLGGVLGLLTTPLNAIFWLARAGWGETAAII